MPDTVTKEKRSEIMSKITSKNTKPEMAVRKCLFAQGFRYRLHAKNLPGEPDIVLPRYKTVIFVHGCFWHGHSCKIGSGERKPKSNTEYWDKKLERNILRFENYKAQLTSDGWTVMVIWECETKELVKLTDCLKPLIETKELWNKG